MPIYEYRCSNCGFQKEYLQKVSDVPHTVCPQCGQETFSKMLTAAGFQLKGSGWYVTDFRGGKGGGTGTAAKPADSKGDKAESKGESKSEGSSTGGDSKAATPPAASSSSDGKAGS